MGNYHAQNNNFGFSALLKNLLITFPFAQYTAASRTQIELDLFQIL